MSNKPMNNDNNTSQLLTYGEAARFLGIGERKMWSLAAGGEIKTVRIGRSVRFDVSDLRQFIEICKK